MGPAPAKTIHDTPPARQSAGASGPGARRSAPWWLRSVTVRFGGTGRRRRQCRSRSGASEIVGLIGTNGAGKSTLMNAIGGFLPSTGTVELLGDDVSTLARRRRARRGLGRTFQAATLFPELTVARRCRSRSKRAGAPASSPPLLLPRGRIGSERQKRAEADELIDFLGLGRYADTLHLRPLHRHPPHRRARRAPRARCRASCASTSPPPASPSARPRRSGR